MFFLCKIWKIINIFRVLSDSAQQFCNILLLFILSLVRKKQLLLSLMELTVDHDRDNPTHSNSRKFHCCLLQLHLLFYRHHLGNWKHTHLKIYQQEYPCLPLIPERIIQLLITIQIFHAGKFCSASYILKTNQRSNKLLKHKWRWIKPSMQNIVDSQYLFTKVDRHLDEK